jgi:hypothetical protein
MRRASTCLAVLGLIVLGSPAIASAEPTASLTTFTAKTAAIPKYEGEGGSWPNTGNCRGCGVAVELEYQMAGEGYGATAQNPRGGIPPISQVNVYLPAGVKPHPAGFGTCTEAMLKNTGPSGCPTSSIASPIGSELGEVTFGPERVPEETELRTFLGSSGPLFYVAGHSPVALEITSSGHYVSSSNPYGEELVWQWPPVATVPGAPLASVRSIKDKLGAAIMTGGTLISYFTLPTECAAGLPFKTEITFGGIGGAEREFGIPAKTLTAIYTAPCPFAPSHTLTVSLAGGGSGSVSGAGISCPGTCSASYAPGTAVTLTATPAARSTFAGWGGACSGAGACTVTMNSDQSATATFTLRPPIIVCHALCPCRTGCRFRVRLTALSETYSTFAVGGSSTPLSGRTAANRHHKGTVFSFRLDRRATVKIAIQTTARGRRVGRTCKPDSHTLRRRPRCTRTVTVTTLSRTSHFGHNKIAFSGRIGGRALKPGHYTAVFAAIFAAGVSPRQSLTFTIVRR